MATFFRNALVKDIGTSVTDVITVAGNARVTVIGFSLANVTDFIVKADVEIVSVDGSGYFSKNLIIPPNSSARIVNGGEKLILKQSDIVKIKANVDQALDAVVSYVEIV